MSELGPGVAVTAPGRRLGPERVAELGVLVAALIFGTTFLVVKDAIVEVPPMSFLAVRFLIGAAALAPFAARRPPADGWLKAGAICGVALGAGYVFQTVGLQHTSASVSAFITYLLVVMVPPLQALVLKVAPGRSAVAGALVCTGGLALLTGGVGAFGSGEALTLGCAVAFAFHVIALGSLAPRHDPVRLTCVQLAVVGGACIPGGLATGGFRFGWAPLAAAAFCGIFASAVALGLQSFGQSRLPAARVSLLLLVEPVSAAVLGAATGERLGLLGGLGAAVILGGIVLSELRLLDSVRADARS